MIHDSLSDIEAGRTYGVQSYLLKLTETLGSCVRKLLRL